MGKVTKKVSGKKKAKTSSRRAHTLTDAEIRHQEWMAGRKKEGKSVEGL